MSYGQGRFARRFRNEISTARAYHRILRLARTIADLADSAAIEQPHLTEAIGYRRLAGG